MKHSFRHRSALALAAALVAGSALAAPTPFYAQDVNAAGAFRPGGEAETKRTEFQGKLVGGTAQTDDLQTAVLGDNRKASLFGGAAELVVDPAAGNTPAGSFIVDDVDVYQAGRFNTSPNADGLRPCNDCKFWEAFGDFTITFAQAIRAFGFYGTDFSDFDGTLDLYLVDDKGGEVKVTVPTGVPDPVSGNRTTTVDGSLIFFGVTDADRYFKAVRFDIQQAAGATDAFGFDDFVIGKLDAPEPQEPEPVPEPATLALAGLALAGLAATRRRKRA